MKKTKVLLGLTLILTGIIIKMATDTYNFEPNQAQATQPGIDSQMAPASSDELLSDKIFNIIWKKTFHWTTFFESLDGFFFNTGATQSTNGSYVQLATSAVLNNEVEVNKQPAYQGLITFSQKSYFRTSIDFLDTTNQTIYLTVGNKDTTSYYGFKVVGDQLYGVTFDGTTENSVLLKTITSGIYNLGAKYSPSDKVVFSVETSDTSSESGVSSSNLPNPQSITPNVQLMDVRIKTTEAVAKTIRISFFEYLQARNILL